MLGFVAAVGAELSTGQTFSYQFWHNAPTVFFHFGIFAGASLMPAVMSGNSIKEIWTSAKKEGMPEGLEKYNADVELMNGRAAMVGMLGLFLVESVKGSALF